MRARLNLYTRFLSRLNPTGLKCASGTRKLLVFVLLYFSGILMLPYHRQPQAGSRNNAAEHAAFVKPLFSEEEIAYMDEQITQLLLRQKFNGNIMVTRYGMVVYQRSFGFANPITAEPLNAQTTFQLASISKTFTATAVLLLQQAGQLAIDDLVQKHIPEFPYNNITIKHLLTHTSGLQNYFWLVERQWKKPQKPNNEDILQLFVQNRRPLNFHPGARFEYSNTGYVFLGLLIERVSGQDFKTYIHQHIFEPLGMEHSFVYDLHQPPAIENRAYGFQIVRNRAQIIADDHLDGPLGDKGIFSNLPDLFKWDQALYRHALLPAQVWEEAFQQARLNNDNPIDYGYGWRLQDFIDKRIVHHPGRWHGFRNSFKRFIDDYTTIIILSNNNQNIVSIVDGVQNIVYEQEKEIWMAANKNAAQEVDLQEHEETPEEAEI